MTLEEIGLAVVRIEGKLDVMAEKQIQATKDIGDHEGRIRALEQRSGSFVTTKMLWSTIIGASTIVGVVSQVIYYASGR